MCTIFTRLTLSTRRSRVPSDPSSGTREAIFILHYRTLSRVSPIQRQRFAIHKDLLHRAYETAGHAWHLVRTNVRAEERDFNWNNSQDETAQLGNYFPTFILYFWQNAPLSGVVVIVNVMFGYKIRHGLGIRWEPKKLFTQHFCFNSDII